MIEQREDANEESVRRSISPNKPAPKSKGEGKGKAAPAKGASADDQDQVKDQHAMPSSTAKPKAKPKGNPKGGGKGKEGGSSDRPKADPSPKGKAPAGKPKPKPKAEGGKPSVKCLFYPNCTRGDTCPFLHEGAPKGKAESKASPAKAPAKDAVATLLTSSFRGAEASRTSVSSIGKAFSMFMYPFKAFFASVAALSSLVVPGSVDKAKPCGSLQSPAAPLQDSLLAGAPVVVRSNETACVASARSGTIFDVEWIADSGASRSLASVRSLIDQGIPESLIQQHVDQASEIRFETGNGTTNSTESFSFHGSSFGTFEHRILDNCPIARSLGEVVSSGRPFIWLPNELPFFGESVEKVQVACVGQRLTADRIEENVPVFKETIQVAPGRSSAMQGVATEIPSALPAGEAGENEDPPAVVHSDADSEDAAEEPLDRMARLVRESQTLEHQISHFPKNPACPICNRSRMYRKKVRKLRVDPLHDRGRLEPVTQFGERLATDFIIVQKLASGKDNTVQVIRDEFSGWLRAYPIAKRDTPTVVRNLLSFLGPAYNQPCIMIKSDQASETRLAAQQLGFVFEGTLENRRPHNSVLERDIRTLEEVTRAVHLQAGFDTIPGLWSHSVSFAATVLNAQQVPSSACGRFRVWGSVVDARTIGALSGGPPSEGEIRSVYTSRLVCWLEVWRWSQESFGCVSCFGLCQG